ncbi:STAS domain-containing protein [Catellatospora sp. NPDC049609]|uniref:STAS domain-containing protein n=1 Tax=Catellatospora sp. NPDC049609 TaxID=3155505 RepID=UPI0034414390
MRSAPATHCYRAGRSNHRHGTSRPISARPAPRTTLNTSTFRRQADILSIRLRTLAGTPRLVVTGEVEASSVYLLTKVADAIMRTKATTALTLDMSAVTLIDGTGVAAVHACHRQAATRGLQFLIINSSVAVAAALSADGRGRALTGTSRLPSPAAARNPVRSRPRGRRHRSRCAQRRPAAPA